MRLLVASTPRSGNTWLRSMLSDALDLQPIAVHHPDEIDWDGLPEAVAIQLHWPPTRALLSRLEAMDIRALTIARHPLDVLVSIAQYVRRASETGEWLAGLGGDEQGLRYRSPPTAAFTEYATSDRAAALLELSMSWSLRPGVVTTRYEDLVEDPLGTLKRVLDDVSLSPHHPLADVVARNSLTALRSRHQARSFHFWIGEPYAWRRYILPEVARAVAARHQAAFDTFGYCCDPDLALTREAALEAWELAIGSSERARAQAQDDRLRELEARLRRIEIALGSDLARALGDEEADDRQAALRAVATGTTRVLRRAPWMSSLIGGRRSAAVRRGDRRDQ